MENKNTIADMKQVMDDLSQMSNNHEKVNRDLRITKKDTATLHEDMTTIITKVQTAVNITMDDLVASSINNIYTANNNNLQNMDETFSENMDLKKKHHSSSTSNMDKTTNEAIAKLYSEINICIINISKDIKVNSTIKNMTDGIIAEIAKYKNNYILAINGIVTKLQAACNSHIARSNMTQINIVSKVKAKYDVIVRSLNEHRDGTIRYIASFQSKLYSEISILMKNLMIDNTLKLRTNLDTIIINHDA